MKEYFFHRSEIFFTIFFTHRRKRKAAASSLVVPIIAGTCDEGDLNGNNLCAYDFTMGVAGRHITGF